MEATNEIKLHITKDFEAPVSRLYQAWIAPDELKKWWHPMGNNLQHATTKPERDGAIEYVFANDKGEHSFTIKGTYKEVMEESRLVYTWNWELPEAAVGDSAFLLTVVFSNNDKGSRLDVTQENFTADEAVQPHRDGWEKALTALYEFLSKQS